MTPADYTALAILGVFAAIAVLGGMRWLVRGLLGLAVGCAVLLALSHFAHVPPPVEIGRFIGTSRIVRAFTGRPAPAGGDMRADDEARR